MRSAEIILSLNFNLTFEISQFYNLFFLKHLF
jgi:hypothetical protein